MMVKSMDFRAGASSVVEQLPSMCEALGSIPSTGGWGGESGFFSQIYLYFNADSTI